MKITLQNHTSVAYARIQSETVDLSVKLAPDLTVHQSLHASAAEMRKDAARLLRRAELIETAIKSLELPA